MEFAVKRAFGALVCLCVALGCAKGNPSAQSGEEMLREAAADKSKGESTQPVNAGEIPAGSVVARVNGKAITMGELQKPLLEGYGLKVLLFQIQLTLARQQAADSKPPVTVTKEDIAKELDHTMQAGFGKEVSKDDYPALLNQLLSKQGVSRAEWDMVIETNAILRKIAEPKLRDVITNANLQEAFNNLYGQTVAIRHIQCANPQEAMQAKMRIASGEKFENVARMMSRNARTAALEGELPPFSRSTVAWPGGWGEVPQSFKDWAFAAKSGDLSDPIQAEKAYHILRLDKKMEPKAIKFEDVKDSIREELYQRLVEQAINELRVRLASMARTAMTIEDPTLRREFENRLAEQQKNSKEEDKARKDLLSRIKPATLPSTTQSTTQPSGTPAPEKGNASPAKAPTGERPPASK